MSGLELAAIGIATVIVAGLLIFFGVRWLVRTAAGKAGAVQRVEDLLEQSRRRAKADKIAAGPFPTNDEVDKWDRGH